MTTFQRGDRVRTSHPGFDPDYVWTYDVAAYHDWSFLSHDEGYVVVPTASLTLVEPPLPPEPPVGSVVFVKGEPVCRYYDKHYAETAWFRVDREGEVSWSDIAADAVPAVNPSDPDSLAAVSDEQLQAAGLCRVEDAADWMRTVGEGTWPVRVFRDRFGPEASDE